MPVGSASVVPIASPAGAAWERVTAAMVRSYGRTRPHPNPPPVPPRSTRRATRRRGSPCPSARLSIPVGAALHTRRTGLTANEGSWKGGSIEFQGRKLRETGTTAKITRQLGRYTREAGMNGWRRKPKGPPHSQGGPQAIRRLGLGGGSLRGAIR
jgi:hypothetical protein